MCFSTCVNISAIMGRFTLMFWHKMCIFWLVVKAFIHVRRHFIIKGAHSSFFRIVTFSVSRTVSEIGKITFQFSIMYKFIHSYHVWQRGFSILKNHIIVNRAAVPKLMGRGRTLVSLLYINVTSILWSTFLTIFVKHATYNIWITRKWSS